MVKLFILAQGLFVLFNLLCGMKPGKPPEVSTQVEFNPMGAGVQRGSTRQKPASSVFLR